MRNQVLRVRDHDHCRRGVHAFADLRLKLVGERLVVAICRCAIACGACARRGVQFGKHQVGQAMVPNGACCGELVDVLLDAIASNADREGDLGRILVPGIINRVHSEGVLAKVHLCEKIDCLPALQTVIADGGGVVHQRDE
jgi:hypothetical protein